MNLSKLKQPWKIITLVISSVLLLHFLKDITQDLLGIKTILDVMGNIQEDTTRLPKFLIPLYWSLWVMATLAQPVVGYLTYKNWKNRDFNKYDLVTLILILFFCLMILWAYILAI